MENNDSITSKASSEVTSSRVIKWYLKNEVQVEVSIFLIFVIIAVIGTFFNQGDMGLVTLNIALKSIVFGVILISFFLNYLKKDKPLLLISLFAFIFAITSILVDVVIKSSSEIFFIEVRHMTSFLFLLSISVLTLIVKKYKKQITNFEN